MKKKIVLLCVLILVAIYFLMLYNTNSVIKDFYSVVNNKMKEDISYGDLEIYKIPSFRGMKYKYTDAKIKRVFVLHNFRRGVMYIKYTYIAYDENDVLITGSSEVDSKWYIQKINGRWIVTDIEERP